MLKFIHNLHQINCFDSWDKVPDHVVDWLNENDIDYRIRLRIVGLIGLRTKTSIIFMNNRDAALFKMKWC